MGIGWRPDSVQGIGVAFARQLSRTLWYLDCHHNKFSSRGITLPKNFLQFQGYNDYRRKKEKEPRLSSKDLGQHIDSLSSTLQQPWFAAKTFDTLRDDVEKLVEALIKYKDYLTSQCSSVKERQSQHTATTVNNENACLVTVERSSEPVLPAYDELQQKLG